MSTFRRYFSKVFHEKNNDVTPEDNRLRLPPLQILTKDSVTVTVDAVVYYRIRDAIMSVCNVDDVQKATKLLAQTTLRNMLGI
jgi:regulator of protease activity HflC (stomatin/prohibitin superfamily)